MNAINSLSDKGSETWGKVSCLRTYLSKVVELDLEAVAPGPQRPPIYMFYQEFQQIPGSFLYRQSLLETLAFCICAFLNHPL